MKVDSYNFGQIVIKGQKYTFDVTLYPDRVEKWLRQEGHKLSLEDLKGILKADPDILIIGTGYSGVMRVLPEVEQFFRESPIQFEAHRTGPATVRYNQLTEEKKDKLVIGAFHLTC